MIVSSTHILDAHTQKSGERYVIERHTDSTGRVHQIGPYLIPDDFDIAARLASRAAEIEAQLADAEALQLLEN